LKYSRRLSKHSSPVTGPALKMKEASPNLSRGKDLKNETGRFENIRNFIKQTFFLK